MKTTAIICVLLALSTSASAQLDWPERSINLKGLRPMRAIAGGTRLVLWFTNPPSELSTVLKPKPTPLQKSEASSRKHRVQVLFGADILGIAELSGLLQQPTSSRGAASATQPSQFWLTFESLEQAAKAAGALRQADENPRPLPRRNL